MRTFIFLLLAISIFSCERNSPEFSPTYFDIAYSDSRGNDLLDTAGNPEAYASNDIDVFFLINGKEEKQYQ